MKKNRNIIKMLLFVICCVAITNIPALATENNSDMENAKLVINEYFNKTTQALKDPVQEYSNIINDDNFKKYVELGDNFNYLLNKKLNRSIQDSTYSLKYKDININKNMCKVNLYVTIKKTYIENGEKLTDKLEDVNHILLLNRENNKWFIKSDVYDVLGNVDEDELGTVKYEELTNYVKESIDKIDYRVKSINDLKKCKQDNLKSRTKRSPYIYNRREARDYAVQYAMRYNPKYPSWGKDCTNFVSQCLCAGHIPSSTDRGWYIRQVNGEWHVGTAWINVEDLDTYLTTYNYATRIECCIDGISNVPSALYSSAQVGDVVQLKAYGKFRFGHSMIINRVANGDIYYCGHCKSRSDFPISKIFEDKSYKEARLLHIKY
ncbi:amidase domain-containing protein [Clostridium botulinum]|uniref:amidase domain-containing protein n=2 Tax=Clostridium botulinum TaxID=1491 RepID=UPI0006A5DE1F|nr:amidase domain-containing protein [Clostridium botulinum]